ncbi:uncharacterized protein F4822DRAFT_411266 [Hypoxylon trugodes]|uniref:uncharacterized protein n=1 Tax=Hypoxylon trugodes TaxID=326681 RepID=UPI002192CC52|nr:uncharacterized protein F4822DRAFT_411266 [Hypoxylon trugodes]KAI1386800.1 hypothetical protein F4822DRAFT_411266 [Hypoxylon trugodes]
MAPTRLIRPPTCLNCLRQLTRQYMPSPSPSPFLSVSLPLQQTRGAKGLTKAEEEDLQGIPVRLLKDIQGFGRKHAIIRVKPGRMRNNWFPKAQAEYMTALRFKELGLTEAAIGTRDRTFGTKLIIEEDDNTKKRKLVEEGPKKSKKDTLTLPPEETLTLLQTLLPETLVFTRKPIPAVSAPPPSELAAPRSPSLAAHAATSINTAPATSTSTPSTPEPMAIFGSVSANDVLALIREKVLAADASRGGRLALETGSVTIVGLDKEGEGHEEGRIKRLGTFEVLISASKDLEPVRRELKVVPEE